MRIKTDEVQTADFPLRLAHHSASCPVKTEEQQYGQIRPDLRAAC